MQSPFYDKVKKLQEKIQEIQTLKQLYYLFRTETMGHLRIDFTHRRPSILSWNVNKNIFSGNYNLLIFPEIIIDDKIFSPNKQFSIKVSEKMMDWETILINTIKQSISQVEFQYINEAHQ